MKIRDVIAAGQMQYLFDGRKGSLLDYSGKNLGAAAITGAPTWARTKRGFGAYVPMAGTNYLSPGNPASLQLSSGTIFAAAARGESNAADYQGIFTKFNAYGLWLATGAENKAFGCYDFGAGAWRASTFTERPAGRIHMFAMTFQSGVANGTAFYVDGNAYGLATVTVLNQASVVRLGSGGAAGQGLGGPALYAGIASRIMTPSDIAEWYDDFLRDAFVLDVQHRRGVKPMQKDMNDSEYARQGIFFDSDGRRLPGGLVRDLSPGGYNGTVTGIMVPGTDGEGAVLPSANDLISHGDMTQLNSTAHYTLEFIQRMPPGNIPTSTYLNKFVNVNNWISVQTQVAGNPRQLWAYNCNGAITSANTTAAVMRSGVLQHFMVAYDGTGGTDAAKVQMDADGENYPLTFNGGSPPATTANLAGAAFTVGAAAASPVGDDIKLVRIYSGSLNLGQRHAAYLKNFAQKLIWQAPGEDCPVSLVASYGTGNPNALGGGWRIISGTWKRSEDSQGRKWIECVTAGCIAQPQPNAFGTFVFSIYRAAANLVYVMFESALDAAWNNASQNGYGLACDSNSRVFLNRITGGAAAVNLTYSAVSYVPLTTLCKFTVNRRPSDGRFTTYIQGGAYTQPTLVSVAGGGGSNPSAADATYETSKWIGVNMSAGDKLLDHDPTVPGNPGHPRIYQGVLDPARGEV